jgi:hypothetical protein
MRILNGVGLAGAAAILDADTQAHDLGIGALGELADARGSRIRQAHDLRTGTRFRLGGCSLCHVIHLVSSGRRFNAASHQD